VPNNSVRTGNISGTGIAVGNQAHARVAFGPQIQEELIELIKQLHSQIGSADIPDGAKRVLLRGPVADIEAAARAQKPPEITSAIRVANDTIESVGVAANKVAGLADTFGKIAAAAGLVYQNVAPFLSKLV